MTTLAKLNSAIDNQAGVYSRHPSVPWFNKETGSNYVLDAYFCASGLSQAFDKIGLGKETGGPYIWTVAWYNWCLNNLTRVSIDNAKPGDIQFYRFAASGDRATAVVNHVTTFRSRSGSTIYVKGFNEGSGGVGGIVGNAAYAQSYLVATFRTPFRAEKPKEEVKKFDMEPYQGFKDYKSRDTGRVLKPGDKFYLTETKKPTASSAANVTRKVPGKFDVTANIYAKGKPGDIIRVRLVRQNRNQKPYKKIPLYYTSLTINRDGYIHKDVSSKAFRTNLRQYHFWEVIASTKNKGDVTITLLDSKANPKNG